KAASPSPRRQTVGAPSQPLGRTVHSLNVGHRTGGIRVLCLGAHADDIEIGCGGFLLGLGRRYKRVDVDWIVFSGHETREREARRSAALFLKGFRRPRVSIEQFRDGFFPTQSVEIKEYFERLKAGPSPDLVLTHYRDDRHQDHRVLSELTWNTFRDHWIL